MCVCVCACVCVFVHVNDDRVAMTHLPPLRLFPRGCRHRPSIPLFIRSAFRLVPSSELTENVHPFVRGQVLHSLT